MAACVALIFTNLASRTLSPSLRNLIKTSWNNPALTLFSTDCCYSKSTVVKSLTHRYGQRPDNLLKLHSFFASYAHSVHAYHAQTDDFNFEGEVVEANQMKKERYQSRGTKIISLTLQKELNCTKNDAETMLGVCPSLKRITRYDIADRIQCLNSFGIPESLIIASPWLLIIKLEDIPSRIKHFKGLGLEFVDGIYLLQLPSSVLEKIVQIASKDKENRIRHLSKLLFISIPEVCQAVVKHTFLCTLPYERLSEIMNKLLAYNITRESILKDVWIFRYDPQTIESRLQRAAAVGYPNMKPWLVHCSEKSFERSLERKTRTLDTLGPNSSVEQYLSHRLDCSRENVKALYRNYPLITTVHVNKMKETLDYLFAENFTAGQIKLVPRILCHSLDTIRERLVELRSIGHNPSSLYTLCLSRRLFAEHVNKLKSRQNQDIGSA